MDICLTCDEIEREFDDSSYLSASCTGHTRPPKGGRNCEPAKSRRPVVGSVCLLPSLPGVAQKRRIHSMAWHTVGHCDGDGRWTTPAQRCLRPPCMLTRRHTKGGSFRFPSRDGLGPGATQWARRRVSLHQTTPCRFLEGAESIVASATYDRVGSNQWSPLLPVSVQ